MSCLLGVSEELEADAEATEGGVGAALEDDIREPDVTKNFASRIMQSREHAVDSSRGVGGDKEVAGRIM